MVQQSEGHDNVKNKQTDKPVIGLSKILTLQVRRTFFVHFFVNQSVNLHDYGVKMPIFLLSMEGKQATTKFCFSFWTW